MPDMIQAISNRQAASASVCKKSAIAIIVCVSIRVPSGRRASAV